VPLCRHSAHELAGASRDKEGWKLSAEEGPVRGSFERVVVAVPAPQAVPLLAARPALARVAAAARLAPCQAVMVTFEEPPDAGFAGAFVEESSLAWVASQASKPGRGDSPSWVLHGTAQWSREHVETSPARVASALIAAFGAALDAPLPPVRHVAAHRWLYSLPIDPLDRGYLWDDATGCGVCGDWLQGDRIEAAVSSAIALGDAIIGDGSLP
jgi:predicted NAD/FAD-dependent oxidoreductase